jgi:integrase
VWFCQYRDKQTGEARKQTLGDIKNVSLDTARDKAELLFAKVKLNQDPAGEAAAKKAETNAALRFDAVVEQYLEWQQKRMKSRSHAEIVRHLRVDAKPLHTYRVDQVTQAMVADLLDSIVDRAPVAANRVRTSLSALFSWAMKRGKATANPVALTDKPGVEKSRDRVLSDAELSLVWRCTNGGGDFDRIVRLLILTGARCREIAGMPWNEITPHNDGTATWLLPSDRSKNERPLELLLPTMATALLRPRREECELIFGVGSDPFSGWSNCKGRLDERIAEANDGKPIAPWRLHDLRRGFVSRINDLGLAEPHIIEALVNHVGGIGKLVWPVSIIRRRIGNRKPRRSRAGAAPSSR